MLAGCHWALKTSGLLGGAAVTPTAPPPCPDATRDRKVDPGSHPGARVSWAAGGPALCPSSWALVPQVIVLCPSLNFYSNLCFRAEKVDFFSSSQCCYSLFIYLFLMGLLWILMNICKLTYSLQRTCVLFPVSAFVFSKNKLKFFFINGQCVLSLFYSITSSQSRVHRENEKTF